CGTNHQFDEILMHLSFTVVVPGDPIAAHVGSTVILPCWISPPENAEALEIRWYRHDQFNNPIVFYRDGKLQDVQECFRNRSSLALRSDQSGGLKDGDVSLQLEKLTFQDEDSFHCEVSGDRKYDSKVVDLKITGESKERNQLQKVSDMNLFMNLMNPFRPCYWENMPVSETAKEVCVFMPVNV
uniref:Ig-like domain-containing protein n=1 Tax=Sinocyclocheilus grahami TaxID=75366 RepID=A0A672K5E6_SINGR